MTDTQLLDWLEEHPGSRVKSGYTRWGKPCWMWTGWPEEGGIWEPAFSLRSAIAAAMAAEGNESRLNDLSQDQ